MPDYTAINDELKELALDIEQAITNLSEAAAGVQGSISNALKSELAKFEMNNGRFVRTQDYTRRLLLVEGKLSTLFNAKPYKTAVSEYLDTFKTIEDRNVAMQKTFNDLKVDVKKLAPARKFVYEQADYYMNGAGFNDAFKQPVRYLLMQQVTTGMSISDSLEMLDRWGKGELTNGKATMGRQTPDLETYASQIAQDTAFQYNGTINNIIKEEYALDEFIYSGGLVAGSRPLCVHLVNLRRPIKFSELTALLKKYPQGQIKGTDKDNFVVYRGGNRCNHLVFAVRESK